MGEWVTVGENAKCTMQKERWAYLHRILFKIEEAMLFLIENHMQRENKEWACCKIIKKFSKLWNET